MIGQNNQLPDPFESEDDQIYRLNNPHLITPDSNYVNYWCSFEILKSTSVNLKKLNLIQAGDFLASFHPSCSNNVEFSEWSNKLLFMVLQEYPMETLAILTKNSSLYRNQIFKEIQKPIDDEIDIERLIITLQSIKDDYTKNTKDIIIKALQRVE